MQIRKLTKASEWLECDRLHSVAFLFEDWDEKEALERFQKQESGEIPRREEAWGLYEDGRMLCSVVTNDRSNMFEGQELKIGELHMVGSLPEERGHGYAREMIREILLDFKKEGYPMAMLIPFSFAFYRKFGFEVCSNVLKQKASIEQFAAFKNGLRARLLDGKEDVEIVKELYTAFIGKKNLAYVKTEEDYEYRGNGEYGVPDFFHEKNRQYTYLFFDEEKQAKGYFKFIYVHGPEGPFTGDMLVQEIVYDSPSTFRSILGFIGGMSAKIRNVQFEMMDDLDLTNVLPEGDQIERSLDSHIMMRALDVQELLSRIRISMEEASFTIEVKDPFLDNSGTYELCFDGEKTVLSKTEKEADLSVSIQTFTQLICGKISLDEAEYREGTVLRRNGDTLRKIFLKRAIALQ